LEGGLLETPKGGLFGQGVFVWLAEEKPLVITGLYCHIQHRRTALYPHRTSSCFVSRAFPGYCRVSININERR
jgi:hypothetical protein